MLRKDDLSPIEYDRVCGAEGISVPRNEIVSGYEKRPASKAGARKRQTA